MMPQDQMPPVQQPQYQMQPQPVQQMPVLPPERHHGGAGKGLLIAVVLLALLLITAAGLAVWYFLQYQDYKTNVDTKVDIAAAEAKKVQSEEDKVYYEQQLKEPYAEFVGPDDYGRLSFKYPKTWSTYVERDAAKGGDFKAYLHPGSVPPVSTIQPYALRVTISDRSFDNEIKKYDGLVKKGDLKSSTVSANGQTGTRLDGKFTSNIQGAAVFFKLRDKTVIIQTDLSTQQFVDEFNKLINTITFNS